MAMKKSNQRQTKDSTISRTLSRTIRKQPRKQTSKATTTSRRIDSSSSRRRTTDSPVDLIQDFKKVKGKVHFLVHRVGQPGSQTEWIAEGDIESPELVATFQQRVETDSGYSISATASTAGRPSRTSKTRAMLRLKPSTDTHIWIEDGSSDEEGGTQRAGIKRRRTTTKAPRSPRALSSRKKIAKEKQLEEIKQRKESRAKINAKVVKSIISAKIDHQSCCLNCSIRCYREAIAKGDIQRVKQLNEATESIPYWKEEDLELLSDTVLRDAIFQGNADLVRLLMEEKKSDRVSVPQKYLVRGVSTGFVSRSTFGFAVKRVNEARGNRKGDASFYRTRGFDDLCVDYLRLSMNDLDTGYVNCLGDSRLTDEQAMNCFKEVVSGYFWWYRGIYFTVASGNHALAAKFLGDRGDRQGFNHLHHGVLAKGGLSIYRRNQILKRTQEAFALTPLHCSAIHPSSNHLKELYEQLNPSECIMADDLNRTVVFFAAVSSTPDCLKYLLTQNVTVLQGDKYKLTPLMQAARFGRHANIRPLIEYMSNGVVPNTEYADHTLLRSRYRPLHYAAHFGHAQTCKELIECGATVDAQESTNKMTPLIFAARRGHVDCVSVLLEMGADLEAVDKYSCTALHVAARAGQVEMTKFLLEQGANSDAPDSSNNYPIHYAAAFGHLKVLQLLVTYGQASINMSNLWRTTASSIASTKGHVAIIEYLLSLPTGSVDVGFKDKEGLTMLHHCVAEDPENIKDVEQVLRKAKLLLSCKANPNATTIGGDTVLHILARSKHYNGYRPKGWKRETETESLPYARHIFLENKTLELDDEDGINFQTSLGEALLEYGADINATNSLGETPLASAIAAYNHPMITFLLSKGAHYWADRDGEGNTFFHYYLQAISYLDTFRSGESYEIERKERLIAAFQNMLHIVVNNPPPFEEDVMIDAVNHNGYTSILSGVFVAIRRQRTCVRKEKIKVKNLLNTRGSRYRSEGESDDSVTEAIFEFRFDHFFTSARQVIELFRPNMSTVVELPKGFLENNPKATEKNYPETTGYSVLHFASTTQHADLLKFLMSFGSQPDLPVAKGPMAGILPLAMLFSTSIYDSLEAYLPQNTQLMRDHAEKLFKIVKPNYGSLLKDSVHAFLAAGGNPCIPDSKGSTSLIKAASLLDTDIISDMTKHITNGQISGIDILDNTNRTALMYALDAMKKCYKTSDGKKAEAVINAISQLLWAGADPNLSYPDGGDTILMRALRLGIEPLVSTLLSNAQMEIDHTKINHASESTLIVACQQKDQSITNLYLNMILNHTVPLDHCDDQRQTALVLAVKQENEQAVKMLLQKGANPNHPNALQPLIMALQKKLQNIVALLIDAGADVNYQDEDGMSILHHAVCTQKLLLVNLIIDGGADVSKSNKKRQTALHLAIEGTKHQVNRSLRIEQRLLSKGADINAVDILGRTPLHVAFTDINVIPKMHKMSSAFRKVKKILSDDENNRKREQVVRKYVNKYSFKDEEVASWFEKSKYAAIAEEERQEGLKKNKETDDMEVDVSSQEKETLEMFTLFEWEENKEDKNRFDPVDILSFLGVYSQVKYDIADHFGRTPLHYAAIVGAFSCTNVMMSKKINVNALDDDQNTPLHLALLYNHVDYSVLLKNLGASTANNLCPADGKSSSTFKYSLSQSYINMAYEIIHGGVTALESIRDALTTGKFHLASILFQTIDEKTLLSVIEPDQQNIWHIITNFELLEKDIWKEDLAEVLAKTKSLNVSMVADTYGRTPIHYASMHGQVDLLTYILSNGLCNVNNVDNEGKTELWYAVASKNAECVQLLLDAKVHVNHSQMSTDVESMVLRAVKDKSKNILELLLKAGAAADADSPHGRPNAVMVACQLEDEDLVKSLLTHNADPDTPSMCKRIQDGKTIEVLVAPVFIASALSSNSILKLLLQYRANPNAIGPACMPENGQNCVMYNVSRKDTEKLKLLLSSVYLDVDAHNLNDNRSIFYHTLFSRYEKTTVDSLLDYEVILKKAEPSLSSVDVVTHMTPLELAIRNSDLPLVELLLKKGADPNIPSCRQAREGNLDLYHDAVPALFHAVLHNDDEMIKCICEHTKHPIQWTAVDELGQTVVMRAVGCFYGTTFAGLHMVKCLLSQIEADKRPKILACKDKKGYTASDHAHLHHREDLVKILVEHGASDATAQVALPEETGASMDVDRVLPQEIEADAELERAALEAEIKEEKRAAGEDDGLVKVDSYAQLDDVGQIVYEDGAPLDIQLHKVDVSFGYYGCNMFYKLSVIYNRLLDLHVVWTRWGSVGEEGMHQLTPYATPQEAINEFKSIFRSKAGKAWEERHEPQSKPGKFRMPSTLNDRVDLLSGREHKFDFETLAKKTMTQLPLPLYNVMQMICNINYLLDSYNQTDVMIPLGQVTRTSFEEAANILKESEPFVIEFRNVTTPDRRKELNKILTDKSNAYYYLLPRKNGSRGIQPFNRPISSFYKEFARLNDISYLSFAANVIFSAKKRSMQTNPYDFVYSTLSSRLTEINRDASVFTLVEKYMTTTSANNDPYEIAHLFEVDRDGECERFQPFSDNKNRKLLWHGSRSGNFMGILSQGLRSKPALFQDNGSMFGSGIYFGDTFCKSLGYTSSSSSGSLLLLCEVALGQENAMVNYDTENYHPEKGDQSIRGLGSEMPDPANTLIDSQGMQIPMGPLIKQDSPEGKFIFLNYNEYIVYNEAQVRIRYLVHVQPAHHCGLCKQNKGKNSLRPVGDAWIDTYDYQSLNDYDQQVVKAYLTQRNMTVRAAMDEHLDTFLDTKAYDILYDPSTIVTKDTKIPVNRQTKICQSCGHKLTSHLIGRALMKDEHVPAAIRKRMPCARSTFCDVEKDLLHTSKYFHWCEPDPKVADQQTGKGHVTADKAVISAISAFRALAESSDKMKC